MIKHVVMWKVKNPEDIPEIQAQLESMRGKVPSLKNLETGKTLLSEGRGWNLVLITTHVDKAALEAYQEDPFHNAVKPFIIQRVEDRAFVDFEM